MCEKNEKVEANEQILEQEGSLNDDVVKEEETVCDHFESASEAADDDVQPDADAAPEVDYQGEISSLQDRLLRLQADFQNYRKRMARELADSRKVGVIDTLTAFLTVFDQLDMARIAAEKSDNVEAIRQGLDMINSTFAKELENLGVERFSAVGETFDPGLHDAVAQQPSDEYPEGVVSSQWCCGYRLGERLLRPARVVVSSGAEKTQEEN